jgi:Fe-S-cluster-containing hydrogenase component 2
MSFANKGRPMQDPQCVRCSACVQMCPTGVLAFGTVDAGGKPTRLDKINASLVRLSDVTVNGAKPRKAMESLVAPS